LQKISDNSRSNFDKNALPHSFNVDDLVWYKDFAPLGKNPKLMPKWSGPAKITEINDTNARILLSKGKSKVLNVIRLKISFLFLVNPKMTMTIHNLIKKILILTQNLK
jgi:hypothetical protein